MKTFTTFKRGKFIPKT